MIVELLAQLFGLSFVAAVMVGMWKVNARRWTRLAREYRATEPLPSCPQSTMQTLILVGGNLGWNSYRGIATVGVTPDGILLKLMPVFSAFHPPLLIPFGDLSIEPKRWYLIGKTHQCTLRRVSDVRIFIHDELFEWIKLQSKALAAEAG